LENKVADLEEMNIDKAKIKASKSVTSALKIKCSQCYYLTVSKHGFESLHEDKTYNNE
jgi:hypothetical protein